LAWTKWQVAPLSSQTEDLKIIRGDSPPSITLARAVALKDNRADFTLLQV